MRAKIAYIEHRKAGFLSLGAAAAAALGDVADFFHRSMLRYRGTEPPYF